MATFNFGENATLCDKCIENGGNVKGVRYRKGLKYVEGGGENSSLACRASKRK